MMMSFKDFIHKYILKKEATSNIKIQQVLSSLSLNDVGICLRDEPFSNVIGIVKSHPSKGTHWDAYINEKYFDCYGCGPPNKLSQVIIKRNGYCFFQNTEYKV